MPSELVENELGFLFAMDRTEGVAEERLAEDYFRTHHALQSLLADHGERLFRRPGVIDRAPNACLYTLCTPDWETEDLGAEVGYWFWFHSDVKFGQYDAKQLLGLCLMAHRNAGHQTPSRFVRVDWHRKWEVTRRKPFELGFPA